MTDSCIPPALHPPLRATRRLPGLVAPGALLLSPAPVHAASTSTFVHLDTSGRPPFGSSSKKRFMAIRSDNTHPCVGHIKRTSLPAWLCSIGLSAGQRARGFFTGIMLTLIALMSSQSYGEVDVDLTITNETGQIVTFTVTLSSCIYQPDPFVRWPAILAG